MQAPAHLPADLWEFDVGTATWRQLPSSDAIKVLPGLALLGLAFVEPLRPLGQTAAAMPF